MSGRFNQQSPSSIRKHHNIYTSFRSGKTRSISEPNPPDVFSSTPMDSVPNTSDNVDSMHMPCDMVQDVSYSELERLHREFLSDNLRLWECVNIIRCNPRLIASNVMQQVFAMTDEEYYRRNPMYARLEQSGHGALSSIADGGGKQNPDKYVQHLHAHNDGMMRENARLLAALELLNLNGDRTADEVISHCFHLSDDAFVRQYPHAPRGSRLRSLLNKLRCEASVTRHRRYSLPGSLFSRMTAQQSGGENSGPSCSNNNDLFYKGWDHTRIPSPIRTPCVDTVYPENRGSKEWASDTRDGLSDVSPDHNKRAATAATRHREEGDGFLGGGGRPNSRLARQAPVLDSTHSTGFGDLQGCSDDVERCYGSTASSGRRNPDNAGGGSGGGRGSGGGGGGGGGGGVSGKRSNSPGSRGASPSRLVRKDSPNSPHGRSVQNRRSSSSPIPYMLSHYPYNWATSNNSSVHSTPSYDYEDRLHFRRQRSAGPRPHDNDHYNQSAEENGTVYGKLLYPDRGSWRGVNGVSQSGAASRIKTSPPDPRISYSKSPTRVTRYPNLTGYSATGGLASRSNDHRLPFDSGQIPTSPRKRVSFHVPRPCQRSRGATLTTEAPKKFRVNSIGKRNSSGSISPRKKTSPRKGPYSSIVSSTPTLAREFRSPETFEQFPPLTHARGISAHDSSEKPKPMYYKPPSEKRENFSEDESDEDDDVYSSRYKHFEDNNEIGRQGFPLLNPNNRSFLFADKSPKSNMSGRSASGDLSSSCAEPIDLTESRHDLLKFRDKLRSRESSTDQKLDYDGRRRSYATNGLRRQASFETPPSLVTSQLRKQSPDSFNTKMPQSTITSLPNITRKSTDTASSTRTSFSPRARRNSPKKKIIMPAVKTTGMPSLKQTSTIASLTGRKPQRCPLRRSISVSPDRKKEAREDEQIRTTPRKPYRLRQTIQATDENVNRYLSESQSSTEQLSGEFTEYDQEDLKLPFLERLLSMPEGGNDSEESLVDKLRREKRQLYTKYSTDYPLRARASSAPASTWLDDQYPVNDDNYERKSSFSEPCSRLNALDARDLPRNGSYCIPSPDRDASYPAARDGVISAKTFPDPVENLRRGTYNLRDETAKSKMCRERRISSQNVEMELAFKSAYDNLGTPVVLEAKAHRHCKKNKNHNSLQPRTSSSWLRLLTPDWKSHDTRGYSSVTQNNLEKMTQEAEQSNRAFYDAPLNLLGEMAFQLERRIIRQVFDDKNEPSECETKTTDDDNADKNQQDNDGRHRFYGFTVLNLPQKIRSDCRDPMTGKRNSAKEARLLHRFQETIAFLRESCGYHAHKHGKLSQELINKHGLFSQPPDVATIARLGLDDFRSVRNHVIKLSDPKERPDVLVLVDCLHALSAKEDGPLLCFKL